jgi:orotate phosphoribosyltransferase
VTPTNQHATPGRGRLTEDLRRRVVNLVHERGYVRREHPFKLASGELSQDYVDGKRAVDGGPQLRLVSEAVIAAAADVGAEFEAVGGLTMGADALAHGVALIHGCRWFSVRKEPKPRGHEQWIEGAHLQQDERVLLVDDVVTTGGSILKAHAQVKVTGAVISGVVAMVDRGDTVAKVFAELSVPYAALVTYRDLGIEPVGPSNA